MNVNIQKILQASLIIKRIAIFCKHKDIYFNRAFLLKRKILTVGHPVAYDLATRHKRLLKLQFKFEFFHFIHIYVRLRRII